MNEEELERLHWLAHCRSRNFIEGADYKLQYGNWIAGYRTGRLAKASRMEYLKPSALYWTVVYGLTIAIVIALFILLGRP